MEIINHEKILTLLAKKKREDKANVKEILTKAKELKGIDSHEIFTLLNVEEDELVAEIFATAKWIKNKIYGNRLVLFAPLYISNLCHNECLYCAFRSKNKTLSRWALSHSEIEEETHFLIEQGHKRLLLVAGEAYPNEGLNYIFKAIETIYSCANLKGNIRRLNVNIAPLEIDEFRKLKEYNIGTYQLFQETYHEETYHKLHLKGPKSNYQYRLTTIDRAITAGLSDVGIGILFGLYDWRYEILALISHIEHLEKTFGLGPHTISVPRLEPALNSHIAYNPPFPVSDANFMKIIAVLRIAVPYAGIILSTRESTSMRNKALELGVSQLSAGSKTNPGGYKALKDTRTNKNNEQFFLHDNRTLQQVIADIVTSGYIPSFCTGCYRLGRTGKDFMDLAIPGLIKGHCMSNALFTFAEYLEDFADLKLRKDAYNLINSLMNNKSLSSSLKGTIMQNIKAIKEGKRDVYF